MHIYLCVGVCVYDIEPWTSHVLGKHSVVAIFPSDVIFLIIKYQLWEKNNEDDERKFETTFNALLNPNSYSHRVLGNLHEVIRREFPELLRKKLNSHYLLPSLTVKPYAGKYTDVTYFNMKLILPTTYAFHSCKSLHFSSNPKQRNVRKM